MLWNLDEDKFGVRSFLSRNRSLRILNLEGNHIHDESVEAIAKGVMENDQTSLERLYLGWNSIEDDGTIALSEMLAVNTSLRVLGLGENKTSKRRCPGLAIGHGC
jgi:Ran GTPase-activating protein (RanGAP) involved in mRNA processing and transport